MTPSQKVKERRDDKIVKLYEENKDSAHKTVMLEYIAARTKVTRPTVMRVLKQRGLLEP